MIKAVIFRNGAGLIDEVRITGHDGSREYGDSIICAAVSALAQTALLGILRHLERPTEYRVASGDFFFKLTDKPDELTGAVLETMVLGLEEIQNIHPNEVNVKEHRR